MNTKNAPHTVLTKKDKKCMRIKEAREELRFSFREMAQALGIPASTFQSYHDGRRPVPFAVLLRVERLRRKVRRFMAGLPARVDARLAVEFPNGIPSENVKN